MLRANDSVSIEYAAVAGFKSRIGLHMNCLEFTLSGLERWALRCCRACGMARVAPTPENSSAQQMTHLTEREE